MLQEMSGRGTWDIYGRMAVEFLDPLERGGKPSNIPGGICWSNLVVLVERAYCQSAAGLDPIFEGGVEARFCPQIQAPHGCEPLGDQEYLIGSIEGPDSEDHLGVRNDSQHPHHALRRLKDMGDGLCPPPEQ